MGLCHGGAALRVSDSTIECWDYNHYDQQGIGTTASRSQPVFVNGMHSARAASLWHENFAQNCAGGDAVAQPWLNLCSAVGLR